MTAFEFMRNSFQILVGVLCWGGTLLVIVLILALIFWVVARDKKGDKEDV